MNILRITERWTLFDETLLRHIRLHNNDEVLSILRAAQNVNPCTLSDSSKTTLLHFAAHCGNEECAQFLIASGAKVDAQNQLGDTPLMFAVDNSEEATARLLLENNANVFLPNNHDQCPLGRALGYSHDAHYKKIITQLLLNRVTIDSLTQNIDYVRGNAFKRDCGLYHFMRLGNTEITRFLLDNGSRINGKNIQTGDTALHVAARRFDLENLKLLLERKANVNAKNHRGQTPLGCIWIQRAEDKIPALTVMNVLIAAGAKLMDRGSRKIMASSLLACGDRDVVRTLLQNRLDLTFRDEDGCTAVHYLSSNRCPGIFEELGDSYFDVNVSCTQQRKTLLHSAASAGNSSSVKFLLDRGADVNALDINQKTPLLYVIEYALTADPNRMRYKIDPTTGIWTFDHDSEKDCLNDYVDCVEILLESGADPQVFTAQRHRLLLLYGESTLEGLKSVITPVLAQLVLHEMSGRIINPHMRNQIEMYQLFKTIFNSAKLQLQQIKRVKIGVSMSLFDFAFASDAKISLYARNKRLVCDLTSAMEGYHSDSYYHLKLRKQFSKFTRLAEMRDKAAALIGEIFRELCDVSVYNVAQRVVNYLDDQEVCKMVPWCKISE